MNTYAIATILGTVVGAPERRVYGETQDKSLFGFRVRVEREGAKGAVYKTDYEIAVFNPQLFPVVQSLLVGQGVQVVAQLTNARRQAKDGTWFDNLGLTALGVSPGAIQKVERRAPAAPQDNYGGGTCTPPRNAKEAAQLPHDEDSDIPF